VGTSGVSFSPASLSIAVGDTVQFSIAGHNVQWSDTGTTHTGPYSRMFTAAGSYPYLCTLHGGMSGVINVS
jgi:plastocyanin